MRPLLRTPLVIPAPFRSHLLVSCLRDVCVPVCVLVCVRTTICSALMRICAHLTADCSCPSQHVFPFPRLQPPPPHLSCPLVSSRMLITLSVTHTNSLHNRSHLRCFRIRRGPRRPGVNPHTTTIDFALRHTALVSGATQLSFNANLLPPCNE